ncbi:MAG: TPD domain-containing protein [Archaeoglobaceae archaeon]
MRIPEKDYTEIKRNLNKIADLEKFPLPRGVLHAILVQKKVESVKRKYHLFSCKTKEILEHWQQRKRFPNWLTLTPVMKVRLLLKAMDFSAKEINKALREPKSLDSELLGVVYEAVSRDFVYSPIAVKLQMVLGKIGEKIVEEELKNLGINFKTEKELKMQKTPDFYFDDEVVIFGKKIRWIESKALFADFRTHELYLKKQISKYKELFGDGIVVYWRGCLEGLEASDGSEFKSELKKKLLEMKITFLKDYEANGEPLRLAEKFVLDFETNETFPYNHGAVKILKNMGFKLLFK